MKGDKIYRAIGDADEKYIKSAEAAFGSGKSREKRQNAGRIIKRVLSVAAAVVIIGGLWVVSFIVTQKRQDPNTSANTGESTFEDSETSLHDNTNGEPDTEADTAHVLSPSDTDHIEIDPDSVCGKMIQSFDEYLKAKERGKYGDYYVSYCVKVNGAYIGFITDGDTDYTQALENEVIDGLPFCYGNGQELTVINGGEYRYGLEAAFADGLINEDELDQLFVEYSSDCSALYNEFKYLFIRQSCDEALNGETLYDVNLSEKRTVTLYNYIDIPFCYKISDAKYAVLYQILHDPVEDSVDEYYDITAGDHVFSVRIGQRFNIIDGGEIYVLDKAGLSEKELSDLFGYYSRHLIQSKNPETEIYKYGIEKYLESGKTTAYADYAVIYAYKTGKGTYVAKISLGNKGYMAYFNTEEIAGITVTYYDNMPFTVIKGDELCVGLSKAYEKGLITADEIKEMNEDYKVFLQKNDDPVTTPFIDVEFEWLDFTNTDRITDGEKAKELSGVLDEYLRGEPNPGIDFCVKLGNGKYAALLERHQSNLAVSSKENVGGYPIIYGNDRKMTVLSGDTAYFGLQNAYKRSVLTDDDAYKIFSSYRDAFLGNYENELFFSLLRGCFYEYLNGNTTAYKNSGVEGKVSFDRFINIRFCMELSANKFAALYSIVDQPLPDFVELTGTVSGYEFLFQNGLELKILGPDKISGLSGASLTDGELKALHEAYGKYIGNNSSVKWNAPQTKEMFDTFINNGSAYNVDYAYKTSDGIYIGIFSRGDAMVWDETVNGYTFEHSNGNKFLVIKDNMLTEGLKEAYESGIISADTVREFYNNYYGYGLNDDQDHSGYETTVYMIRANRDGYGVSTKTISTCDLAYSIIDALGNLSKTGEIADKTSDGTAQPNTEHIFSETERGMLWLQVGSKIYRVSSDLSKIALVDSHFGKGYVLNMTDGLKKLLNDAWYYFPYDTYTGTYNNESKTLDISHTYAADSTIEIKIKELNVEKKIDPENSVTLEVTSSLDQYVPIYLNCYQSDDNLAPGDRKELNLKAGEKKEITLNFGGWEHFRFWIDVIADNTRVTLTIDP